MADTGHLLLTTFERDGSPVSAAVRGVVDGHRAYVGAWSNSGSARRLQYTDAVQVTPCGPRGFCVYGEPLDATARLLSGDEASRAAERLAIERPVQRRFVFPFLFPLPRRTRGRRLVHYELLVSDAAGSLSGSHENHDVVRVHCAQTRVTAYGAASIECIWPSSRPAHSSDRHMAGIAHP